MRARSLAALLLARAALAEWPPAVPALPNLTVTLCAGSLGSFGPIGGRVALDAPAAAQLSLAVDIYVTTDGPAWSAVAAAALAAATTTADAAGAAAGALPSAADGWPLTLTFRHAGSATAVAPPGATFATWAYIPWALSEADAFASYAVAYVSRASPVGAAGAPPTLAAVAGSALGGAVVTRHVPVTPACHVLPAPAPAYSAAVSTTVFAATLDASLDAMPSAPSATPAASPAPSAGGGAGHLNIAASGASAGAALTLASALAAAAAALAACL
jgi:hypothetical protein